MSVLQPRPVHTSERSVGAFARFLFAGLLWLVIGAFAGRYLFPEIRIEQVEKQVEIIKRVEVPVDRIVERVVVKEVEKRVEVPVEKIVYREVQVPPSAPRNAEPSKVANPVSPWNSVKAGMTKSEVSELLGEPRKVVSRDDFIYWYYTDKQEDDLFIRFKVAGLFGFDRVEYWLGPDRSPTLK